MRPLYSSDNEKQAQLQLKRQPAAFSGPSQLKQLVGACFDLLAAGYKYRVCPFQNITQEEVASKVAWELPFKGVLGVWAGNWRVQNFTFDGTEFEAGDDCGEKLERSVLLSMACDESNGKDVGRVLSVSEPSKCRYELNFVTRLLCHEQAALVYPRLASDKLRLDWDVIETQLAANAINETTYNQRLDGILIESGFRRRKQKRRQTFSDLASCARVVEERDLTIASLEASCRK